MLGYPDGRFERDLKECVLKVKKCQYLKVFSDADTSFIIGEAFLVGEICLSDL